MFLAFDFMTYGHMDIWGKDNLGYGVWSDEAWERLAYPLSKLKDNEIHMKVGAEICDLQYIYRSH